VLAYFLVNIVYAPSTWQERMQYWLFGGGKAPAVWARSDYTIHAYLYDGFRGVLTNYDAGGVAILLIAIIVSGVGSVPHRYLLWLPTIGFLAMVILTTGYMPAYFLIPINVTSALPVAASLAYLGRAKVPGIIRRSGVVMAFLLVAMNVWGANMAWAKPRTLFPFVAERYCVDSVRKTELIFLSNLWQRQPGFSRLTYLGFNIDDRALGELMTRPERMPDVVLIQRAHLRFLTDFANLPARTKEFEASGFAYDQFQGYEALGYEITEVVSPSVSLPIFFSVFPWYSPGDGNDVLVYRRR
jgi:hypothetical protein